MQLDPSATGLSCHLAPGQRVVCVTGAPWHDIATHETFDGPAHNDVCVVMDVLRLQTPLENGTLVDDIYLRLDGWPRDAYHHLNFRPLRETSIDVFTALLNKTPTSEPITRREKEYTP